MKNKLLEEIIVLGKQMSTIEGDFDVLKTKAIVTKLQEQLTVLAYLESQIKVSETNALDSKSYREDNWFKEPVPVPRSQHKEELVEPAMEKIKDIVAQIPPESQQIEDLLEEILPQQKLVKNDLEDFASTYQEMPTFERKKAVDIPEKETKETTLQHKEPAKGSTISEKPKSINDTGNGSLTMGLNDRIAFTKHLFDGNADDLQRVLSQINTFTTLEEAATFIKTQVKPDYNNWIDKEEFEERFSLLLDKRFD